MSTVKMFISMHTFATLQIAIISKYASSVDFPNDNNYLHMFTL